MTRRLVSGCLVGALATVFAGSVAAQLANPKGYMAGPAAAPAGGEIGYVLNAYPTPTDGLVKSGIYNARMGL